jgi:hypothetical protein
MEKKNKNTTSEEAETCQNRGTVVRASLMADSGYTEKNQ